MSWLPPCNFVLLEGSLALSSSNVEGVLTFYGSRATRGASILGYRVRMCRPDPCIISSSTTLKFSRPSTYKVEQLKYNYLVRVSYSTGGEDVFVYPKKVWEPVEEEVIKAVLEDKPTPRQGAVLYGPPGTGKTSLAELISLITGLYTERLAPYDVLSMWLGQSEARLKAKFVNVASNEPAILIADDADWLLKSRAGVVGEARGGSDYTFSNLVTITLETIEEWKRNKRKVMFVATTNLDVKFLDTALLRSGRLGRAIYIPLPDYEAVYELLVHFGIEDKLARSWARKAVAYGLSMADVRMEILEKLAKGIEPKIEPRSGEGYRRYAIDLPSATGTPAEVELLRRAVERYLTLLSTGDPTAPPGTQRLKEIAMKRFEKGHRTVLWIRGNEHVAVAVAHALINYHEGLPAVVLVDPKNVESAVEAANSLRGFIIVPSSLYDVVSKQLIEAQMLAVAGDDVYVNGLRLPILPSTGDAMQHALALAEIVLSYYGIEHAFSDVVALARRGLQNAERFLADLALAGVYGSSISNMLNPLHMQPKPF
jgi:hypothetical protein